MKNGFLVCLSEKHSENSPPVAFQQGLDAHGSREGCEKAAWSEGSKGVERGFKFKMCERRTKTSDE